MNKLELKNYNLEKTLLGGQAFNWDFINGSYYGFTVNKIIKVQPTQDGILWQTYPEANNSEYIKDLLNINQDFDTILKAINKDNNIASAIETVKDVRLLKQDFDQAYYLLFLLPTKILKQFAK